MQTISHQSGGGRAVAAYGGAEFWFKAEAEDTDGAFSFLELLVSAGWAGPPPHVHGRHDETFYVVEGEFEFKAGSTVTSARVGDFLFVPRHTAHAFSNPGSDPAKLISVFTPGGYERYFDELARLAPAGQMPDAAAIYEVMKRYDTEPATL